MSEQKKVSGPNVLVVDGRYHLGNNPGVFQEAAYVGWSLVLPIYVSWYDDTAPEMAFIIETQDIETWGGSGGHRVFLNDVEIGRLVDRLDKLGPAERYRIAVATPEFQRILGDQKNARLSIRVDVKPSEPALADDFLLRRIETEATLAVQLGARTKG